MFVYLLRSKMKNGVILAGILTFGALLPILFVKSPALQIIMLWLAMQFAIQISFGFIPNSFKVALLAVGVIFFIQAIWKSLDLTHTPNKSGPNKSGPNKSGPNKSGAESFIAAFEEIAPEKCGGLVPDDQVETPTPNSLIVRGGGCGDINATNCWADPEKKLDRRIENLLKQSSELSYDIETYLRTNVPDKRCCQTL